MYMTVAGTLIQVKHPMPCAEAECLITEGFTLSELQQMTTNSYLQVDILSSLRGFDIGFEQHPGYQQINVSL